MKLLVIAIYWVAMFCFVGYKAAIDLDAAFGALVLGCLFGLFVTLFLSIE